MFKSIYKIATLLFLILNFHCVAQDSIRIIIISDEIGPVIDIIEKKSYNILPAFGDEFISAYFYTKSDSQFYGKVTYKSDHSIKDTILKLNYISVRNLAARVQLLDSQRKGNKDFNPDSVELKFADGDTISDADFKLKIFQFSSKSTPFSKLPLAERDSLNYFSLIRNDFEIGLSLGLFYNFINFDNLIKILNHFEENINVEEPYTIPRSDFKIKNLPVIRFTSLLFYKKQILVELEYSNNLANSNMQVSFESFAIAAEYYPELVSFAQTYIGLGYSTIKFSLQRKYNTTINSRGSILESIGIHGKSDGLRLTTGLMKNISSSIYLRLFLNYNFYSTAENVQNIDLKSFDLGLSFYLIR